MRCSSFMVDMVCHIADSCGQWQNKPEGCPCSELTLNHDPALMLFDNRATNKQP
jgi:hypothetical protein